MVHHARTMSTGLRIGIIEIVLDLALHFLLRYSLFYADADNALLVKTVFGRRLNLVQCDFTFLPGVEFYGFERAMAVVES